MKRLVVLTGGGHISAFNAALAAIIKQGATYNWQVLGSIEGWRGLLQGEIGDLTSYPLDGGLSRTSGSIILSSRTNPVTEERGLDRIVDELRRREIEAVIAYGGDDTLSVLPHLARRGVKVIGIPKTMDNDVGGTHFCFGYPTAVMYAGEALRNAHFGAYTHGRVAFSVLFGRNTDWVSAGAGYVGCADVIIPAERAYTWDILLNRIREAQDANATRYGRRFAVVAIAEGAKIDGIREYTPGEVTLDAFGHPKLRPLQLAAALEVIFERDGITTNGMVSTYEMRDTEPCNIDCQTAALAGTCATSYVNEEQFGVLTSVQYQPNGDAGRLPFTVKPVSLEMAAAQTPRFVKNVDGFFDYEQLTVGPQGAAYFAPLFGQPVEKRKLLYPVLAHELRRI